MLRPDLLMSAQQVVAQTLTNERIEVRFDADVPHADLINRVMHLRPLPDELDHEQLVHVRADCDHELAHFKWTDADAIKDESPLVQSVTNVIEDGMIERRLSKLFFGCAENLAESNALLLSGLKDGAPVSQRAMLALTQLVFGYDLPTVLDMVGEDAKEQLDLLPDDLLEALPEIETTAQSVEIAKRVIEAWGIPENAEDAVDPMSWHPVRDGASLDEIRKGVVGRMDFAPPEYKDEPCPRYVAYTENDAVEPICRNPRVGEREEARFWTEVQEAAPNLRRRLLMEFRGQQSVVTTGHSKGRIDQRRLHRLAHGDHRLFKRRTPGVEINTDVTLMVDLSASMLMSDDEASGRLAWGEAGREDSRLYVAAQTAACFSLVLSQLNVSHEVLAWTTDNKHDTEAIPGYDRVRGLRHVVVRDHNASFASARRAFVDLAYDPNPSENVDGEALLWGAQRLVSRCQRKGNRPLMIVFSDGMPLSRPEDYDMLAAHFRRACQRVQAAGIPLVGVGIQTDHLAEFIPRTLVVRSLRHFVTDFYGLLRSVLRESKMS